MKKDGGEIIISRPKELSDVLKGLNLSKSIKSPEPIQFRRSTSKPLSNREICTKLFSVIKELEDTKNVDIYFIIDSSKNTTQQTKTGGGLIKTILKLFISKKVQPVSQSPQLVSQPPQQVLNHINNYQTYYNNYFQPYVQPYVQEYVQPYVVQQYVQPYVNLSSVQQEIQTYTQTSSLPGQIDEHIQTSIIPTQTAQEIQSQTAKVSNVPVLPPIINAYAQVIDANPFTQLPNDIVDKIIIGMVKEKVTEFVGKYSIPVQDKLEELREEYEIDFDEAYYDWKQHSGRHTPPESYFGDDEDQSQVNSQVSQVGSDEDEDDESTSSRSNWWKSHMILNYSYEIEEYINKSYIIEETYNYLSDVSNLYNTAKINKISYDEVIASFNENPKELPEDQLPHILFSKFIIFDHILKEIYIKILNKKDQRLNISLPEHTSLPGLRTYSIDFMIRKINDQKIIKILGNNICDRTNKVATINTSNISNFNDFKNEIINSENGILSILLFYASKLELCDLVMKETTKCGKGYSLYHVPNLSPSNHDMFDCKELEQTGGVLKTVTVQKISSKPRLYLSVRRVKNKFLDGIITSHNTNNKSLLEPDSVTVYISNEKISIIHVLEKTIIWKFTKDNLLYNGTSKKIMTIINYLLHHKVDIPKYDSIIKKIRKILKKQPWTQSQSKLLGLL